MKECPLRATPSVGMHSVMGSKLALDTDQFLYLMADKNHNAKSGSTVPCRSLRKARHCLCGRSVARTALVATANAEPLGRTQPPALRNELAHRLVSGDDWLESPAALGSRDGARSSRWAGLRLISQSRSNGYSIATMQMLARPVNDAGGAERLTIF